MLWINLQSLNFFDHLNSTNVSITRLSWARNKGASTSGLLKGSIRRYGQVMALYRVKFIESSNQRKSGDNVLISSLAVLVDDSFCQQSYSNLGRLGWKPEHYLCATRITLGVLTYFT